MGSSCLLEVKCTTCGNVSNQETSEKTGTSHTGFDVNRRIVASATASGMGFAQTKSFFCLMGMPQPMSENMWYFYKGMLNTKVTEAANEHLEEAVSQVRRVYADKGIGVTDNDGVLDITVSVDGSWQKRGHKSHNGVVTVIEHHTGLVVDYIALSNYCHQCETGPKADSPGYAQWYQRHENQCQKNTDCASGAMEVEGACILFCRSVEKNKLRYTKMLGDGDAKTHARIEAVDPYEGRPILKLECVNHVAKRLGSALRDLKARRSAQNRPIGGRGKLTDDWITKLTGYYGSAIKENSGDLDGMERAVWASYHHVTSTDDEHNHDLCPEGRESWCFFKRAAAEGVEPRPHSKALPADVAEAIKPIYERLSNRTLLAKCLEGWTQNNNECFHSLLWSLCPKVKWASLKTVETCLALAVQRFNRGSSANLALLKKIEITPAKGVGAYAEQQDIVRVKAATRKSSNKQKERRKKIDEAQRAERQERLDRAGVMYGAGQF